MHYYIRVFQNYANFKGRDTRKQYWMFVLINSIVFFAISFVSELLLGEIVGGFVELLYSAVIIVPSLTVSVRRMHDIGKSGWWILTGCIPLIGWIWYIILVCQPGDICENEYNMPNDEFF